MHSTLFALSQKSWENSEETCDPPSAKHLKRLISSAFFGIHVVIQTRALASYSLPISTAGKVFEMQDKPKDPSEEDESMIKIIEEFSPQPPGSLSEATFHSLMLDAVGMLAIPSPPSPVRIVLKTKAIVATLHDIAPQSEHEARLVILMIGAYEMATECTRRSMVSGQTFEGRDLNHKHAAKLIALYEQLYATLEKHRGKGWQRITVEHVTVEAGGQAIVGEVRTDGKSQPRKAEQQRTLPDKSTGEEISREQLKPVRSKATERPKRRREPRRTDAIRAPCGKVRGAARKRVRVGNARHRL